MDSFLSPNKTWCKTLIYNKDKIGVHLVDLEVNVENSVFCLHITLHSDPEARQKATELHEIRFENFQSRPVLSLCRWGNSKLYIVTADLKLELA